MAEQTRVDELTQNLRLQFERTKPTPRSVSDPSARVLDALERGESLGVVKPFKWGGETLQSGDDFRPAEDDYPRVAQIAEHGYVLPQHELQIGYDHSKIKKFYKNEVDPKYQHLNRLRTNEERARAARNAAQLELEDRENELATATSVREQAEDELKELLEGSELLEE